MRILTLATVFPNPKQPTFGVFVRERVRRLARRADVTVVAPVPWFPFHRLVRGDRWDGIPTIERQGDLVVHHPRFACVPKYLKSVDATLYAAALTPFLRRLRRTSPFDVIDAHFAYPDGMAAVLAGRRLGVPVVITLRGSIVRLATYRLHRPQIRFALNAAARVFAVSESLKTVAMGLGVPEAKIAVIPNGVDTDVFFPMDRAEARRSLGLPLDRPLLLSVGAINEGKGHHRVVAALPKLLAVHPNLLYVIAGAEHPGDSFRGVLERSIKVLDLGNHVMIAGARPQADIRRWLGAADLFCLATRSEGWPNVLLEALACGRPVVSTDVGGAREIVCRESLGLLVPPGDDDALGRAILDGLARWWDEDELATYARRHSWDDTAARVLAELGAVLRTERSMVPAGLVSGEERG